VIIGKNFIWLHFPKCAGTELESVLHRNFSSNHDLHFDPIEQGNVIWHHTIDQRRQYDPTFDVGGRDVICNIRRLPAWLLSRVHFEIARTPGLKMTREMLLEGKFFEHTGQVNRADSYMMLYSRFPITHWIRTEFLRDDVEKVFSRYLSFNGLALDAEFRHTNANKIGYIKDPGFYFTKRELAALYEANPLWADVERRVYGSLEVD
jgi:hypothetical protein